MKTGLIALGVMFCILFVALFCGSLFWDSYWYPKNYEYALKLADDASLPQDKAKYLREYLDKVKVIKSQPRYFFMTPDLELSKQVVILGGLIQRFDDLSGIKPSEMAYQQGMQQLTGQELDHQLDRIAGIFKSAKIRESLFIYLLDIEALIVLVLGIVSIAIGLNSD